MVFKVCHDGNTLNKIVFRHCVFRCLTIPCPRLLYHRGAAAHDACFPFLLTYCWALYFPRVSPPTIYPIAVRVSLHAHQKPYLHNTKFYARKSARDRF